MNYLQIIIKNKRIILILLLISIISLLLHVLSQERFVPYNIQETIIHKNIEGKNKYFIYGTFTIKSQCFLNPTTKGMYIVPVNSKGKVLEETNLPIDEYVLFASKRSPFKAIKSVFSSIILLSVEIVFILPVKVVSVPHQPATSFTNISSKKSPL